MNLFIKQEEFVYKTKLIQGHGKKLIFTEGERYERDKLETWD